MIDLGVPMSVERGSDARLAMPRTIIRKLTDVDVCARGIPPDFTRVAFDSRPIDRVLPITVAAFPWRGFSCSNALTWQSLLRHRGFGKDGLRTDGFARDKETQDALAESRQPPRQGKLNFVFDDARVAIFVIFFGIFGS